MRSSGSEYEAANLLPPKPEAQRRVWIWHPLKEDGLPPVSRQQADAAGGRFRLRLTPHGHLLCGQADDASDMDAVMARRLNQAFVQGSGVGLLRLGGGEVGQSLPPAFVWWRSFATRYGAAL